MEREEEIRRLAYSIWEKEGYPHGRDIEHWLKAETIWQGKYSDEDNEREKHPEQKQKKTSGSRSARKATSHVPPAGPTDG